MNQWGNVYQSIQQAQQMQNMNFTPVNNINPMFNQMNYNNMVNSPIDQIQLMSMFFKQNIPQLNMGGNPNFNMDGNQNLMMNNVNQNFNMNKSQDRKINVCFSTLKGARINMSFNADETVDSILTKFLKRVNLENLINNLNGKLNFILSAENLHFGDKRKLKDIILFSSTFTTILVHDSQNLIGANNYLLI